MNNEGRPTLNDWPAGPNAFGLYLVLGILMALIVVGAFGFLENGNQAVTERSRQQIVAAKHSTSAGNGAGAPCTVRKGGEPAKPEVK